MFKGFNISTETGAKKLADLFNSVGISFSNRDELNRVFKQIEGKSLMVSCWVGQDKQQASKFIKNDDGLVTSFSKPAF